MKKNRKQELIEILSKARNPLSAADLSRMMGVSERSIRSYVKDINDEQKDSISSGKEGYWMDHKKSLPKTDMPVLSRSELALSRLLNANKKGVSPFDLAEDMFVSESTILNSVIPEVKNIIRPFQLRVESRNYTLYLEGAEKDKRHLIGSLVTENQYGFSSCMEMLESIFPDANLKPSLLEAQEILSDSPLFFNNYALNNLLVHLAVIILRQESGETLPPASLERRGLSLVENTRFPEEIGRLTEKLGSMITRTIGHPLPESELDQIQLLLVLSTNHSDLQNSEILDNGFLMKVEEILKQTSERYSADLYDQAFLPQFAFHMYNCLQRCAFNVGYPNPIADQFKTDYAPVYDIAVYIAHLFSQAYHVVFSENEIAFIAFHIGGYMENARKKNRLIQTICVMEEYHSQIPSLIERLNATFSDYLNIIDVVSLNDFEKHGAGPAELIITTLPSLHTSLPAAHISPLLTRQNIVALWSLIEEIDDRKKQKQIYSFFEGLFHEELYFDQTNLSSRKEILPFLGQILEETGYAGPAFLEDVALRESMSNTAFTPLLAMPHTISCNANRSFVAVIRSEKPIQWGKNTVRFVLMVGMTSEDMKQLRYVIDLVIRVFTDPDKTRQLMTTDSLDSFVQVFLQK